MTTQPTDAANVDVACRREEHGWTCDVRVTERSSQTSHVLTVSEEELARYSPTSTDVESLVERAFGFLLEREPKEAILRRFAIRDIERYFPEFAAWGGKQRG